jgi:hypothetical protein
MIGATSLMTRTASMKGTIFRNFQRVSQVQLQGPILRDQSAVDLFIRQRQERLRGLISGPDSSKQQPGERKVSWHVGPSRHGQVATIRICCDRKILRHSSTGSPPRNRITLGASWGRASSRAPGTRTINIQGRKLDPDGTERGVLSDRSA